MGEIRSDSNYLLNIEDLESRFISEAKIGAAFYKRIRLALSEASQNAFTHGNMKDPKKTILFTFEKKPQTIELKIKDMGKGFDYRNISSPILPENRIETHGRGLFLIADMADKLEWNIIGNEIKITFNL